MIEDREAIEGMRYARAKKRVEKIKGFYVHFAVYLVVNIFLSSIIIYGLYDEGDSYSEAFSHFGVYSTWVFWGIGVVFHWLGVFGFTSVLGRNWEEKKLKEILDREDQIRKKNGF